MKVKFPTISRVSRRRQLPGPTSFGPGFDRRARHTLALAQRLAWEKRKQYGPGEILTALSRTRGPVSELLAAPGSTAALTARLLSDGPTTSDAELAVIVVADSSAQQVIDTAKDWATAACRLATPMDLLLALCAQDSQVVNALLTSVGLSALDVQRQARERAGRTMPGTLTLSPLRGEFIEISEETRATFRSRQEAIAEGVGSCLRLGEERAGEEYDAVMRYVRTHALRDAEARALLRWHMGQVLDVLRRLKEIRPSGKTGKNDTSSPNG